MTTSELIELLRKADPDGTAHIRTANGIPYAVDLIQGFLDTPYSYIDDEGNYVLSTRGFKLELYSLDVRGFVEKNYQEGIQWEDIKQKFKFDLTQGNQSQNDIRISALLKRGKDAYDEIKNFYNNVKNPEVENLSTSAIIKKKKRGLFNKKNNKI